ncbi:hypothetical protein [Mycobacterium angelicum]|uniref:Uncharacterized protein n=1 Tax=Mycobacterium angelicum TaxID=470074 RepID=A0A1W9ZAK9_MYCAN|nr:hypothetical protein [Mycobacterium angelicum]MCV7199952.1 hypothetical protein [Mycobacterium angelicum]ORA10571.1 hypothetical protein BST12_26560 [Mycobacterium angelicum]
MPNSSTLPIEDDVPASPVDAIELRRSATLITEQEVLLASAVALSSAPRRRGVFAAIRSLLVASADAPRRERRHYPPRHAFLEDSRMAREMHRL